MAIHPDTGQVWTHEHGPRGGDEVNVIRPGVNYGWPVITHGISYAGFPIGEGNEKPGMAQPLYDRVPSIAPSGMASYTVGAEERLLEGAIGRTATSRAAPTASCTC